MIHLRLHLFGFWCLAHFRRFWLLRLAGHLFCLGRLHLDVFASEIGQELHHDGLHLLRIHAGTHDLQPLGFGFVLADLDFRSLCDVLKLFVLGVLLQLLDLRRSLVHHLLHLLRLLFSRLQLGLHLGRDLRRFVAVLKLLHLRRGHRQQQARDLAGLRHVLELGPHRTQHRGKGWLRLDHVAELLRRLFALRGVARASPHAHVIPADGRIDRGHLACAVHLHSGAGGVHAHRNVLSVSADDAGDAVRRVDQRDHADDDPGQLLDAARQVVDEVERGGVAFHLARANRLAARFVALLPKTRLVHADAGFHFADSEFGHLGIGARHRGRHHPLRRRNGLPIVG